MVLLPTHCLLASVWNFCTFAVMGQEEDIQKVTSRIISVRDTQVLIDRDVAELYGVTTRDINKAVKNNPDKFPQGYMMELTPDEKTEVVEIFHHLQPLKYSHASAKAFTEKGLYMLATILKSPLATETTIAIIETFSKLRQLSRAMQQVNADVENGGAMPTEKEQGRFRQLMNEIFADPLPVKMQKMTFGVNLGIFKITVETTRGK